ncbi:MAG: HEAT repeat domain-containing protein [Chloroflexi bacterium]|nr:HEAT repeat domain-containing protein [Chloroflexota bacterium]
MPSLIEKTIAELANHNQPILNSGLAELSNLTSAELEIFKRYWPAIEVKRRRQIVYRLVDLAEDNLELNFDCVLKYCLKDTDDEVRTKAIEGLWENEEPSLISPLINLLEQGTSEKVRVAATMALGKFALLAEHKKLRESYLSQIKDTLLAVFNQPDNSIELRRRALEAVAPLSLPEVKTAIMEAYQSPEHRLKVSAIYSMGKNCSPDWLQILIKELASDNAEVCYEAVGACGELGEEDAVPRLINLVNSPDVDIQMAAIQALGKIGGTRAKECLEVCSNDTSEAIRQTAEQALIELEALAGDNIPHLFDPEALDRKYDYR